MVMCCGGGGVVVVVCGAHSECPRRLASRAAATGNGTRAPATAQDSPVALPHCTAADAMRGADWTKVFHASPEAPLSDPH